MICRKRLRLGNGQIGATVRGSYAGGFPSTPAPSFQNAQESMVRPAPCANKAVRVHLCCHHVGLRAVAATAGRGVPSAHRQLLWLAEHGACAAAGIWDSSAPVKPQVSFEYELWGGATIWAGNAINWRHKIRAPRLSKSLALEVCTAALAIM